MRRAAWIAAFAASSVLAASASSPDDPAGPRGPYARIAFLRPRDANTVDFEAGYVRHLEWHRQAGDAWRWYGWTIWAGDRQRWLVYATFGHAAEDFDAPVSPAEDERDNVANVVPHADFAGNALYEFLPAVSRGTGVPAPSARAEMLTVELAPGAGGAFEAALAKSLTPVGETLWFRMIAGGSKPRYVRLRPRGGIANLIEASTEAGADLSDAAARLAARLTVEIITLRPTLSYNLPPGR